MRIVNYNFGIFAEKFCLFWLFCKGYKILAHRYKCFAGEIDIIALQKNTLIFIEVKARKKSIINQQVLFDKQISRIMKTAEYFVSKNQYLHQYNRRFDLIEFSSIFNIKHKPNFMK